MSISQTYNQPSKSPPNWTSIIQLVLSALASLILLGVAALIAIASVIQYFIQESSSLDLTQSFMMASSLAFAGALVLPSAWYAWKRVSDPEHEPAIRPEPKGFGLILTLLVLVLVPGALWLGNWVSQIDQLAWFILPLLNIVVNSLPALWIVYMGIRGLNPGPRRRTWGVFASGLVLSPSIILILELFALVGFGFFVMLWAVLNPGITDDLQNLIFRVQNSATNPDAILRILLPFLLQPGILFIAFAFISVIVPLIEEALKPIGVWFLAGQKLNPTQGFAFGVLCGVGFGLFENLGNTSAGGEMWAVLASTRITTLLLHCLTTGMVGWALASAWTQRRYVRLGITYAVAVVIHGLWNGMAVLSAIGSLEGQVSIKIPPDMQQIGSLATIGIIAMGAFNLVLYLGFNTALRNNLGTRALPISGEGATPSFTTGGSAPIEQNHLSTSFNLTTNPSLASDTHSLPSNEEQHLSTIDTLPKDPESTP